MKIYDKRRQGFFVSEHTIFDQWGGILGPLRLVVYLCLVSHAGYKTREGYPSYQTLANKCDISRRKVIDCVSDLVYLRFLEKERREAKSGDPDSNNYGILDIPEVEIVIAEILNDPDSVPKKHQWVIEKLETYQNLKNNQTLPINLELNDTYKNQAKSENLTEINNVGQDGAKGVVHDIHQGSACDALGVVHDIHQGSACDAPEINTITYAHLKHTHLLTPNVLKWDFNLRNLDEAERMYVCDELNKLDEEKFGDHLQDMAQTILDEANFKQDHIKLSLSVYVKGLVTKANKGNFTPTHNLALKRKKKALEANKAAKAKAQQREAKKNATAPPDELLRKLGITRRRAADQNLAETSEDDKQKEVKS